MMVFQLGDIYWNKTKKYLLPCLVEYGEDFSKKVSNLFKLAVGIGDHALTDMGLHLEKHLFILVDTSVSKQTFPKTIQWLRGQPYYETDYPFDDIHTGKLHMIVIKFPEKYYNAYGRFTKSQFSKMYSKEDIGKLFKNKERVGVLTKDKEQLSKFLNELNKKFNTSIEEHEWPSENELDFTINMKEEMFNKN